MEQSGAPDLVIELPGRLLYRFDSVIANEGGTLDLFRDPGSGAISCPRG